MKTMQLPIDMEGLFNFCWDLEAGQGGADERGGMEYHRVWEDFLNGGAVSMMREYIHTMANKGARGD